MPNQEAAVLREDGGPMEKGPAKNPTFAQRTTDSNDRSRRLLQSLACPLDGDPPWDPDAKRGDVRTLLATRRAVTPDCSRLAEGTAGEVACSRCLREVIPWSARKVMSNV